MTHTTTTSTARSFKYKASRDIATMFISIFIALVGYFILKFLLKCGEGDPEVQMLSEIFKVAYLPGMLLVVLIWGLVIYANTFCCLTIGNEEITYRSGWLNKKTVSIPAAKIRSCSIESGILQRLCGTATIAITTAGDASEIKFYNIMNGKQAFKFISQLAKKNER